MTATRSARPGRYRLVIFDQDGTLADSFGWFLGVVNTVADRYRFRRIEPDQVEALRSLGARDILKVMQVPRWKLPLIARHMRGLKAQRGREIALFPGVEEAFRALRAARIRIAMVSSDSEANVRATLGPELAALVDVYACGASLFGKAAKFRKALRRAGVRPEEAIAVGDETRDAIAAREAGIAFGAVAWGYATLDALLAHAPAETFATLDEMVEKLTLSMTRTGAAS